MKAEDKKAIFANHKARSSGTTAFNSNRSVHFNEGDDDPLVGPKKAVPYHRPSLVVEGNDAEQEAEADDGSLHPHLPKTSSYFVQSRFQQSHQQQPHHEDKKCDGEKPEGADVIATLAVVDQAIAQSEAVSQAVADAPPADPVDYVRMLPKLNSRGLPKWENLARQLHLPLHLVKLAVRSRLGNLVNLEDEEYEEDSEEGGSDQDDVLVEDERELSPDREDSPSVAMAAPAGGHQLAQHK